MIPNKSNFKFQELTPITGVKPYVIRYWETEFTEISPIASEKGEKIYSRGDVEAILRIKKLLFEDKLTIPEAKLKMLQAGEESSGTEVVPEIPAQDLTPVKALLKEALEEVKVIKARRGW
jgi:DNA-binding transcriptional MerR regulator